MARSASAMAGEKAADRPGGMAHVLDRARRQGSQARAGFRDDVLDHLRDQPAHQFMHQPPGIEPRCWPRMSAGCRGSSGSAGEVVEREQPGAQPVVDVMGVIGDVVGDGGDLGLGAGKAPQLEILSRPMKPDRVRHAALAIAPDRAAVASQ